MSSCLILSSEEPGNFSTCPGCLGPSLKARVGDSFFVVGRTAGFRRKKHCDSPGNSRQPQGRPSGFVLNLQRLPQRVSDPKYLAVVFQSSKDVMSVFLPPENRVTL